MSQTDTWSAIETNLNRGSISVYQLPVNQIRIDATTNSGYHRVTSEGLFQFGKSKDNPNLPQIKTMMASLDPWGMPLVTNVVSGERAEDGLYVPALKKIFSTTKSQRTIDQDDIKLPQLLTITEQSNQWNSNAEKLLEAFKNLTLTLFRVQGEWYGDVTELNPLQNQILRCLGLSPDIYSGLVENST